MRLFEAQKEAKRLSLFDSNFYAVVNQIMSDEDENGTYGILEDPNKVPTILGNESLICVYRNGILV